MLAKHEVTGSNPVIRSKQIMFATKWSINILMLIELKLPESLAWLCPIDGVELTRLGNMMDGGYVVPVDIIQQSEALLSLGLGDNWTFDQDWHRLKPQDAIHMYDGTVDPDQLRVQYNIPVRRNIDLRAEYDRFFQAPRQHWQENVGPGADQTSLATCLARLGSRRIFIKMDIEGGEYPMIGDLINYRDHITGMVMEFHFCNGGREQFQTAVQSLQVWYDIVHVHGNNHVDTGPEGLTDCMELTLINRQYIKNSSGQRRRFYIDGLDFSNVHGQEDLRYCL